MEVEVTETSPLALGFDLAKVKRVLIYRLGSLGDTTIALPALHLIARSFPAATRHLLTNIPVHAKAPAAAAILGGSGLVEGYIDYPVGTRSVVELAKIWLRIRSFRPDVLVYLSPPRAVLVCAFLVAFFPILSNTALGLASVDHALLDLFDLYHASAWRRLIYLRAPAALPQFLAGLRIAGGLALIGAVVAELAAGAAGQGTGLAFRIVEAGFRLDIPRMFAALALLSLTGVAIYGALSMLTYYSLRRWHESARERGA